MSYGNTLEILKKLAPGSPVQVWFDDAGFQATYFQFYNGSVAAFRGGALNGGLTYLNPAQIAAIKVGS